MKPRRISALKSVAAGSALVLALAACGQQEAPSVTEPADGAAGQAEDDAQTSESGDGSAAEAGAEESDGSGDPLTEEEFLPALMEAVEDKQTVTMDMTLDVEAMPITLTGVVDMNEDAPAMEVSMAMPSMPGGPETAEGGELQLIMVGGAMYASVPGLTEAGSYFAIEAGDPMMDELGAVPEQMNPETTWDAWKGGMTELEYVGQESVEGESLDHYTVTVDVASALEAQGGATGQLGDGAAGQLEGGTVEYDVWLDEERLMRQITFELAGTSGEIDMSGWGEPVDITAPDGADVVDFPLD